MHSLRLIGQFMRASVQEEAAYRLNFWISLLHSLIGFVSGYLALEILFSQVDSVRGWTFESTLALLGVYFTVGALRSLFISPSLDALAGMDGEVWTGALDFTLLRPVNIQFLASLRKWRMFSLFDLLLGLGVLGYAAFRLGSQITAGSLVMFLVAMFAGMLILYAILLAFASLVFWSPGVMFGWIFDGVFQLARFPVGVYPGWLRLVLTWIIPVSFITTLPAEALAGTGSPWMLAGSVGVAVLLTVGASLLFKAAVRRYASASS